MISAIVIAKDEQDMIGDCLKSINFVDEILVIDNASTDNTSQLSRQNKAKVFFTNVTGFDNLHNFGLTKASGDWILYLDADERISPALRQTISRISNSRQSTSSAYEIIRQNIYLGKSMNYGGWGNDSVIRLFKKSQLLRWEGNLHEQPKFKGKLGKITDPIIHYSHRDLYSMTEKTILFTNYEATNRFNHHHPLVVWWRFIRVMFTEYWLRFIKLSAWRDGPEGVIDGIFQVFNAFIIYGRLWELQNE